ncbi:MAG: ABC transporter ATP-binding protein/permease [Ruminococcaceae bacterium]|nr:ABC transporter ATP-binding protein/permease [Oscillospiraceae bacterium]
MLELKQIVKTYVTGDSEVHALNGVSLKFRENEFVSILGPSGCGKTTMLNIIGGLDRYTSGDLVINGTSTKEFRDGDWDSYRNHSIGFVFQSYNLIPHQTVLSNVELALTLSGVSKGERRTRAIEALTKVGLGDQLHKKPNQMSGGQMQRVAIARALVNNPDILLADEPTGALDTQTSVQIMELLKEVSQDKLVIMVTHNPELAEEYSTRIVRLRDGEVIDDTAPFGGEELISQPTAETAALTKQEKKAQKKEQKERQKKNKTSMSFLTALSLSKNNLLTKKGRTILTSFAGSIGIIGIALILSLSNGIQLFIDQVQEDTLSTYPLSITKTTADYTAMLSAMTQVSEVNPEELDEDMIYIDDSLGTMMSAMSATVENDLTSFKAHLDENYQAIASAVSDIQYTYDLNLQIYTEDGSVQVSPTTIFDNMGSSFQGIGEMMESMGGMGIFSEMIDNQDLLDQQYELVGEGSHWPENENEVVLVVGKNNTVSKMTLYMLGVLDQSELEDIMKQLMTEGEYEASHMEPLPLEDFLGMKFRLLNAYEFYEKTDKTYVGEDGQTYNIWNKAIYEQEKFVAENGTELVISGIVRPKEGVSGTSISGAVGYTRALTDKILAETAESEIIKQQKATPETNVLTGLKFERIPYTKENINELIDKVDDTTMEQLYAFMTAQIFSNEEFLTKLQVTPENFMGFAAIMNEEQQTMLVDSMLSAAKANPANAMSLEMLRSTVATMKLGAEGKDVTMEKLLPLLSAQERLILINGIPQSEQMPMDIVGLKDLCPDEAMNEIYAYMNEQIKGMSVNDETFPLLLGFMGDEEFATMEQTLYNLAPQTDATYDSVLADLGDAEKASPASINFYAKDFESKEVIETFIKDYSDSQTDETKKIQYTDMIGALMSGVSTIIDVISYVLVAFVSVSLVVSSIMIGIITYISVLERTKEIGILRAIGASKKDISRVFNAETLIVGFAAGLIGVVGTILLCLPINAIIHALTGMDNINAVLPWVAAIVLVGISMLLTFIAGLIPSKVASKKDPVEALRSE